MSSSTDSLPRFARKVRLGLFAAFFAFAVLATAIFAAANTNAQSIYGGGAAYGQEVYSAESQATDETVGPPNTGFAVIERAAKEQPVVFWGSTAAISAALALAALGVVNIMKRKQEN